jgi:uncharacterized protein
MGLHLVSDPVKQDRLYVERLAALVEESELDRVVLLAFDEIYDEKGKVDRDRTYLYVSNDYVRKVCDDRPDIFTFGASVHPSRNDALDELERVAQQGACLVKLLPNSQGFDPADPRFVGYWRKLADLDLPLLIHCGFEHTIPPIDQKLGDPVRVRSVLEEGVKVIVAHAGSSGKFHLHETFGDTLALLTKYQNCWCDTSALANFWRSKYLFELLDPPLLKRVYGVEIEDPFTRFIHGSDYPIPITPFAFIGRTNRAERRRISKLKNPLQMDIELKRLAGVPDECLTRTAEVLALQ